jgi:serine/threonine protein kinase
MTRTENSRFCKPNWATFSGTLVPGGYEVRDIIEADAEQARFRIRVLGDWSATAFLDIFHADDRPAEEQVALWAAAKELRHPNLSSPLAAGELDHQGAHLIYAVLPGVDENLASVLRERALTVEEAREILNSLRRALECLHGQGWVHGNLAPQQVLAIGDSIEISTEHAGRTNTPRPMRLARPKYVAPEASGENLTTAADVWCMGATLFESLTQKTFSPERLPEVASLPQPFNRVAERCLDPNPQTRCPLSELGNLIAGRRPSPPRIAEPVPPPPKRREAIPIPARVAPREEQPARSSKLWIYIAAAAGFVLLMLWAARPRHQYPVVTAPVPPARTNTIQPAHAAPKITPETKTLVPQRQVAQTPRLANPMPEKRPAQQDASSTRNGPVWRVIVFTYAREPDAEKRAQSLNERHPNLDAKVFSPNGQGSPYLVTVGGNMTREEAARLRQRVVGLGLPRDSYIQNYKQ